MNLNQENWKPFHVADIFDIRNGKGITQEEIEEHEGDFIAVQSGENNNGVMGKIDKKYCIKMNYTYSDFPCLTVARSGTAGFVSYQKFGCVVGDSAKILDLKDKSHLSDNVMCFLQTLLLANRYKFDYGYKVTAEKYSKIIIKLPVTADGTPDWQFMEDYMKSLHYKPLTTKNKKENVPKLEVRKWKEFRIGDLFDVSLSEGDIQANDIEEGNIPLVSSGETNNGIVKKISAKGDGKAKIFEKNKITVDMFCHAFYQSEDFYAVSHGRVNILSSKEFLNKYIALFVSCIINKDIYKYNYGRAVYSTVISNVKIKLPVTTTGEPDWQWMEDYIKALPYGDRI